METEQEFIEQDGSLNLPNGCIPDAPDERDFKYTDVMGAGEPTLSDEEWDMGFDAHKELGILPTIQDQGSSLSCTAQATAAYFRRWVYKMIGVQEKLSPKFIYPQIVLPQGGAYIRDAMLVAAKQGIQSESKLPSYLPGGKPPSEAFMRDYIPTKEDQADAKRFDLFNCRMIEGATSDINVFAHAIKYNLGVVGGFTGTNNGWTHPICMSPEKGDAKWGHCVDLSAFGRLEEQADIVGPNGTFKRYPKGTKCLFTRNSWGERYTMQEGRWKGYQAIPEDYFKASEQTAVGPVAGVFVFNSWVFVPDTSIPMDVRAADILKRNKNKLIQMTEPGFADSGRFGFSDGEKLRMVPPVSDRSALMCLTVLISNGFGTGVNRADWDAMTKVDF